MHQFLGNIVDLQDRIALQQYALNFDPNDPANEGVEPPKLLPSEKEEIFIPQRYAEYVKKKVDFNMFVNILMHRKDTKRCDLSIDEFRQLDFSLWGFPKIALQLLEILT